MDFVLNQSSIDDFQIVSFVLANRKWDTIIFKKALFDNDNIVFYKDDHLILPSSLFISYRYIPCVLMNPDKTLFVGYPDRSDPDFDERMISEVSPETLERNLDVIIESLTRRGFKDDAKFWPFSIAMNDKEVLNGTIYNKNFIISYLKMLDFLRWGGQTSSLIYFNVNQPFIDSHPLTLSKMKSLSKRLKKNTASTLVQNPFDIQRRELFYKSTMEFREGIFCLTREITEKLKDIISLFCKDREFLTLKILRMFFDNIFDSVKTLQIWPEKIEEVKSQYLLSVESKIIKEFGGNAKGYAEILCGSVKINSFFNEFMKTIVAATHDEEYPDFRYYLMNWLTVPNGL